MTEANLDNDIIFCRVHVVLPDSAAEPRKDLLCQHGRRLIAVTPRKQRIALDENAPADLRELQHQQKDRILAPCLSVRGVRRGISFELRI